MQFKDIIGQEKIKKHLISCVDNNKLAHALLFCGSEGAGKLPLAIALAQYIQCTNKQNGDSCNECASCLKIKKLIHPDLHFVFPITKDKGREICDDALDDWRKLNNETVYFSYNQWLNTLGSSGKQAMIYSNESEEIMRKLNFKAYESDYKIMIIWLPEKMHLSCANKLLKILEEPPQQTLFILVSEQPNQLLSTILSRTQIINIPVIDNDSMQKIFGQQAAHYACGNYIKAQEYLNSANQVNECFGYYRELMGYAYSKNLASLKLFSEKLTALGRESAKEFLQYAQNITRECFIYQIHNKQLNYLKDYEAEFAAKFFKFININNIEVIIEEFAKAENDIAQNVNGKIVFFDLGIKLMTQIK